MAEETREEEVQEDSSVLNMSDEELANFNPQEQAQEEAEEETSEEEQEAEQEEEPAAEEEEEASSEETEEDEEPEETREVFEDSEETTEQEAGEETSAETNEINYKEEYERLLSPFRASKRDIRVKSVDDARRLMQMGADYQFKMQALKPQLRIMRALEKNGLLDQDKINFMIDLDKKNPEAIKKFLKDKEIDPLELDLSEETAYQAQSYTPTEQEAALEEVIDEIRETDSFQRTIDEIGNKWDAESKKQLSENPALIKVINQHVANGIYDQVRNVVENERLLGRLAGMNDLMAYEAVGKALQEQGAFNAPQGTPKPKSKRSQDPKLKARKKAASPTKRSSPASSTGQQYNPLSLSDEEFEKMTKPAFA
jgi:hypothetical protein